MELRIRKEDLYQGLNVVSKAVNPKSTQQILGCVLIDADGTITFTGNDTELGIKAMIIGEIIEKGHLAVEAKILTDIVSKMPNKDISLKTDGESLRVECGKAKFSIPYKTGDDFPEIPVMSEDNHFKMSARALKAAVSKVAFAASISAAQKSLESIHLVSKDGIISATALDGHRIAIRNVECEDSTAVDIIVNAKSLNEVIKVLGDGDIDVYADKNRIMLKQDGFMATTRLIDGDYFNIDKIFSSESTTRIMIDREEILDCLERTLLLYKDTDSKKPVVFDISDSIVRVSIKTVQGEMNEDIAVSMDGEAIRVGCNSKLLIEAIKNVEDDLVNIYFSSPKAPIIIQDDANKYKYVVLPVNLVG